MEKRLGVIAIIVKEKSSVSELNEILHAYSGIIVGRMGIPYPERGVSVISVIVDGSNDEIGALGGKIGALKGISAKSVLTK